MYYYLSVCYYSHDLCLDEESDLAGPFESPEARQADIDRMIKEEWDLEENTFHVALLEVRDGKLIKTESGLAHEGCLSDLG